MSRRTESKAKRREHRQARRTKDKCEARSVAWKAVYDARHPAPIVFPATMTHEGIGHAMDAIEARAHHAYPTAASARELLDGPNVLVLGDEALVDAVRRVRPDLDVVFIPPKDGGR